VTFDAGTGDPACLAPRLDAAEAERDEGDAEAGTRAK
jgi:hypothetical protein